MKTMIKNFIDDVYNTFGNIKMIYSYEHISGFHIIEYEPVHYQENDILAQKIWDFDTLFRTTYPEAELLITVPSQFHDMSDLIYEVKPELCDIPEEYSFIINSDNQKSYSINKEFNFAA